MAEYIEREAAVQQCKRHDDYTAWSIKDGIEAIPAADVVPVVRCKDCKSAEPYTRMDGKTGFYCKHQKCTLRYGTNWGKALYAIKEADDFCSYGERREGE